MKRSTLVALVVLIALVGVVYWLEQDDGSSGDVETVFDIAEHAIDRVEIRRIDEEPVVIERRRDSKGFRIVAPTAAACDPREVELVLSNLASMTVVRSFTPVEDAELAKFGLESSKLEVRFTSATGSEHGLLFGNDTLTASNQYASRIGSDDVLVVASQLSSNLDKSAWDLQDKAIFHVADDAEPVRVTITRGADTLVLAKAAGVWMNVSPPRARVGRFTVTGFVERFRQAEMLSAATSEAATGLDPPEYRVEVNFSGDTEPLALDIGSKKGIDSYARVPSTSAAFVIEGGLVAELRTDPRAWWSEALLHHPTTESTELRITDGANVSTLARRAAQELLRAISSVTVDDIVTTAPSGEPKFVVSVTTEGLEDEISFRVENGVVYASRKDEDISVRLATESWTELAKLLSDAPLN